MAKPDKAGKKPKVQTLDQVQNLTITESGDNFDLRWDPVAGATKYSVRLLCAYDLDGDGIADDEDDEIEEVEEGSSATTISISKARLLFAAEEGEPPLAPLAIEANVKPMAPGNRGGKKKGTWSDAPAVWPTLA